MRAAAVALLTFASCAALAGACSGSESGGDGSNAGASGSAGATAGSAGASDSGGPDVDLGGRVGPELGLKIAFFGDQGVGATISPPYRVLEMIKAEGADFVIHLGDFDYNDDPPAFETLMNDGLGADYPWFAVVGNHDVARWDGYLDVIQRKLAQIAGAECVGEPGVKHACSFHGLHFVLSGVGLLGSAHEEFIRDDLAGDDHLWQLCGWHLNMREMQLGDKGDEVGGWGVFQECQKQGAMITSGHEHSYGRTLTLTDVGNSANGHGAIGEPNLIELMPGRTFVTISGIGGQSIRAYDEMLHGGDTWWAAMFASDWEYRNGTGTAAVNILDPAGASFLEFGVDGDPRRVRGYFKTAIQGRVVDEFEVTIAR